MPKYQLFRVFFVDLEGNSIKPFIYLQCMEQQITNLLTNPYMVLDEHRSTVRQLPYKVIDDHDPEPGMIYQVQTA